MTKPWFDLVWVNPPRTTKKQEWKTVNSFLRLCRWELTRKLPDDYMKRKILDLMLYGTSVKEIPDD